MSWGSCALTYYDSSSGVASRSYISTTEGVTRRNGFRGPEVTADGFEKGSVKGRLGKVIHNISRRAAVMNYT